MSRRVFIFVGLALIIIGTVFAYLTNFNLADVTGFAVTMFGAGLTANAMYEKRDTSKNKWLSVLTIVLVGGGGLLLGFGGFSEDTMTTVITSVFGVVAIIGGLILSYVSSKGNEN